MKLKNIPNVLSGIRICLVFVFAVLFFSEFEGHIIAALIVFLLAGATDIIDGYLARKFNWITALGKILDPVADKLMQCTVLVCLCIGGYVPLWFVIPFFIKEIGTLCIGFIVIKRRSVTVVSKWYGKLTVCLFYATIVLCILLNGVLSDHEWIRHVMCIPAVSFAIFSFVAYIRHYSFLKKEEVKKGKLLKGRKEQ